MVFSNDDLAVIKILFEEKGWRGIVFTDEKDFTLEIPLNRQNSRVYGSSNERKSSIASERLYHETIVVSLQN